jgi:hypothetical protein
MFFSRSYECGELNWDIPGIACLDMPGQLLNYRAGYDLLIVKFLVRMIHRNKHAPVRIVRAQGSLPDVVYDWLAGTSSAEVTHGNYS